MPDQMRTIRLTVLVALGAILGAELAIVVPPLFAATFQPSMVCAKSTAPITMVDPPPFSGPYATWLPSSSTTSAPVPTWKDGSWHPAGTAETGITALNGGDRPTAERMLAAIREQAKPGMWLPYGFAYTFNGVELPVPWFSGYAQAQALSLASRLRDRPTADALFATLRPGSPAVRAEGDSYWIEEYPDALPDEVLNGHIYGLFGLWDYWRFTGSAEAHELLIRGLTSVRARLGEFLSVDGHHAYYDTAHNPLPRLYDHFYVEILSNLRAMTGEQCFGAAAQVVASMPMP